MSEHGHTINTLDDLAAGAEALFEIDPRFRTLHEQNGLPRLRRREGGLAGLAHIVVGQLISTKAANSIWARVEAALAPFDADRISRMPVSDLAGYGLTRAKATAIIGAAQAEQEGAFNFEGLAVLDNDAAAAELKKLRGVGQWTADIYLVTCLGRCDAWPAGDLAVRAGVQLFEQLADVPSVPDMDAHGERWRPWRAVAACYLWGLYASDRRRDVGI
ncbi:MAG: DNA-3-methyladenine glycosylase 2 family protein [Pseudomonadota bacterium]